MGKPQRNHEDDEDQYLTTTVALALLEKAQELARSLAPTGDTDALVFDGLARALTLQGIRSGSRDLRYFATEQISAECRRWADFPESSIAEK